MSETPENGVASHRDMPDRVVMILLDSLNRHMLGAYGGSEFDTPNLDRFARSAVRFDNHYTGSLPCMPARHDLLCGALDFLWKPWGSIELWEEPLTVPLRRAGVTTQLISDHPHLFEIGGENYHCDFTAWDYQRGHESDPWKTRRDPSWIGTPVFSRGEDMPYELSRGYFQDETDFPGPRTMAAAARWIDEVAPHHERFLLFVDEFDPHEPFDTPEPYASMYDDSWSDAHLIWPPYTAAGFAGGILTPRQAHQIRACYGAKLTMIDQWFGRILDALETQQLAHNTAVIVCTDHGHYLGEKDAWGKPAVPVYETLGHTPLMISWPGSREQAPIPALTTNVDISATLLDIFGVSPTHATHGYSLVPLLDGKQDSIRDLALSGVWAREVHVLDGDHKYARAPVAGNAPLSIWSNRWSTMPVHRFPDLKLPRPDHRATLDRMPGSDIPVIRQPFGAEDNRPFWALGRFTGDRLYDLKEDPNEERNLENSPLKHEMEEKLRSALIDVEAPAEQLQRLGLS
ncbi:MAG: sulfatase [Myxococcota bacterium]